MKIFYGRNLTMKCGSSFNNFRKSHKKCHLAHSWTNCCMFLKYISMMKNQRISAGKQCFRLNRICVRKLRDHFFNPVLYWYILPDITGRTALAVRPDVLNAKYHVKTNATYSCHNRDPVLAKLKHVTNIET